MAHQGAGCQNDQRRSHVGSISRGSTSYKRRKTTNACQVCRARRTKCDNERPCSFCKQTGSECISSPSNVSSFDSGTLRILERMDDLESHLLGLSSSIGGPPGTHATFSASPGDPPLSQLSRATRVVHSRSLFPQNLENILQWKLSTPLRGADLVTRTPSPATPVPQREGQAYSLDGDLDWRCCSNLIDAFFLHVHPKNPILDEASVRGLLKSTCFNGFAHDAISGFLLQVLALGAIASPLDGECTGEQSLARAAAFNSAAQKRFATLANHSYVEQAKCLFYSGVYLMSTLQPFEAWRMFLQALAACQGFRLLSSLESGQQTPHRDHNEESLYWSCWKSEREVRSELGLPDFSTAALAHPHLYPSLPQCEGDTLREWYFYLAEISLWRLETSAKQAIAELVHGESADMSELMETVDRLEALLQSWQSSLPSCISLENENDQARDILRFVLRGRLTYNQELLTCGFINHAIYQQPDLAEDIRERVASGLSVHHARLAANRPGFKHQHHGTWLMMRSSARSAYILLAVSVTPSLKQLLPFGWIEAVWSTIEMLDYWNARSGGMESIARFLHQNMIDHYGQRQPIN